MKKSIISFCMGILLFAACKNPATKDDRTLESSDSSTTSAIQPNTTDKTWVAVDSATETKAWMDYATPGDVHKMLAKSDGNWTGQTTMWMGMGSTPTTNTASMSNKMVMGGRYQMSSYSGNFMGMPFEGMAITGYDNFLKKFVSTWIDNMGTGIMKMEGPWDEASKSITYTGKMVNPANGQECEMKEIYKIVDDNNVLMEMYGPDSKTGKEYKTMEIKLTRKK